MAVEIILPKMTDNMEAAEIVRWLVQEGDRVEAHQPILEVMTDKVTAEVEAPASGVLRGIRPGVDVGAVVPVGEVIAYVGGPDEPVPALPPLGIETAAPPSPSASPAAAPPPAEAGKVRATPAARAVARELGVDIARVRGTGPEGRVREEDVRALHAAQSARQGSIEEPGGAFDWVDLTPVQRRAAERLSERQVPQFALTVVVDATALLDARQQAADHVVALGHREPSLTAFLVKLVAATLREHPRLNASVDQGRLKVFRAIDVGVAVGTEQGLVVPVIRSADSRPLEEVAGEIERFQRQAASLRFAAPDLVGGTFTISNLGMYGIDQFAALVNPPESAILAVGRIARVPVGLPDATIALRPTMALTLTVDHRAVDGLQAAAFLRDLKARIEAEFGDW